MNPSQNDFEFCPTLEQLLRSRRTVGASGKVFDGLGALSSQNNPLTLRRLMLETKPKRMLEIELSFGGSALVFASTHRDLNLTPQRQHTALDPFQKNRLEFVRAVGAGVCVLAGVRIGRGAVIGAGAVVTRDVAPFAVVPSRVLKHRD